MRNLQDTPSDAARRVMRIRNSVKDALSLYPNTSTTSAYCSFRSQTIHLLRTRAADFKNAVAERRFADLREDLATIFHEVTHWADSLGSLWGQQHILKIFAAYDVVLNQRSEDTFWAVIQMYLSEKRVRYSDYYRFVRNTLTSASTQHPWSFTYSAGRESAESATDPFSSCASRTMSPARLR
jgi:hypothetical protein